MKIFTKTCELLALTAIVGCWALMAGASQGAESETNAAEPLFKDKNLEAAVRKNVFEKRNNDEPLTEEDVANLSTVKGDAMGIEDLSGLEKCHSLASLDLANNQIVDLGPLRGLGKLQYLNLANNRISDVRPLGEVKALQYIELSHNQIRNIRPLGALTNLASLYLFHNRVVDLYPVTRLPKLTSLYADNNELEDIQGVGDLRRLSILSVKNNRIRDLSPLVGLTDLYHLFLENNEIRDLTPLYGMVQKDMEGPKEFAPFLNIYLDGNPLNEESRKQVEELKEQGARIHP